MVMTPIREETPQPKVIQDYSDVVREQDRKIEWIGQWIDEKDAEIKEIIQAVNHLLSKEQQKPQPTIMQTPLPPPPAKAEIERKGGLFGRMFG